MADRYAPALLLEVLAFWFVLRWLLIGRAILFVGRALVLMMVVGVLGTLDEHRYIWAGCFAGSAVLAWVLLRRWRGPPRRVLGHSPRPRISRAWRRVTPAELAALCERRVGLRVDAAVPAAIATDQVVLALAGDGVWVLEDESKLTRPGVGRVLGCWTRQGLVARVEHLRRGNLLELSWPARGALLRGVMPSGDNADLFAGYLVADEFALNS
jgi:hypothetical protein